MGKIILIDDDDRLGVKLQKYFEGFSLELDSYLTPSSGLEALKSSNEYEVLLLDGMLPEMDGFEVCKKIREFSNIPIIFLTGRVEEADKILGLEHGADDYVTKPFSPRELVARVKSQLRRNQNLANSPTISEAQLELNTGNYTAFYSGKEIKFTATEFEILKFLVENKGNVKSREEIMEGLYGDTWEAFDRSLDIAISRIRKKLKEGTEGKELIKTVRLKGYMFVTDS